MQRPLAGLPPPVRSLHAPNLCPNRLIAHQMVRVKRCTDCRCNLRSPQASCLYAWLRELAQIPELVYATPS